MRAWRAPAVYLGCIRHRFVVVAVSLVAVMGLLQYSLLTHRPAPPVFAPHKRASGAAAANTSPLPTISARLRHLRGR